MSVRFFRAEKKKDILVFVSRGLVQSEDSTSRLTKVREWAALEDQIKRFESEIRVKEQRAVFNLNDYFFNGPVTDALENTAI